MPLSMVVKEFFCNIFRCKGAPLDPLASDLRRCLGLVDLTFLSIGSTLGVGIYITMGEVTRVAGPSVILSYLFAGIASILSALGYAGSNSNVFTVLKLFSTFSELAARYPIAGSSYQFTYMAIGEIWAFFVGWNITLEHAIGCAAGAGTVSRYLDSLFGNPIVTYLSKHAPMPGGLIATYPDAVGAVYIIATIVLVAFGIKLSSGFNIFFASLNFIISLFIIISAMILGTKANWTNVHHGGFMPNGFLSTIRSAATIIFAYIGYEIVGITAEEAMNPRRNIPLSLIISITVATVLFMSVAAAYISMVPWYHASTATPFSDAYMNFGWYWAKYLVAVGIIVTATAGVIGFALAVPRYIFVMARDGLLMNFLARVNSNTQVPLNATIVSGVLCVILTIVFSLKQLIDFMSIGQLIASIFVAVCVVKLRYKPINRRGQRHQYQSISHASENADVATEDTSLIERSDAESTSSDITVCESMHIGKIKKSVQKSKFGYLFEWTNQCTPGNVPMYSLAVAMIFSTATLALFLFASAYSREWWFIVLSSSFLFITVVSVVFMYMFAQDDTIETFKIPCAPFSPFISIAINLALIMKLNVATWIRLGIWMGVGLVLYFGYGYRNSKARNTSTNARS